MKKWREQNRQRIKEYNQKYMAKYYQEHRIELIEKNSKYCKQYRLNNPEKIKLFPSNSTKYFRTRYYDVKESLFKILGSVCSECNESFSLKSLEAHHFNYDGHLDRNRFSSAFQMYVYYVNRPNEALQKLKPLCKKCHRSHHWKLRKEGMM